MLKAATNSARAWTAPALWRFDPAPSSTSAPAKLQTILHSYRFATSTLRNAPPASGHSDDPNISDRTPSDPGSADCSVTPIFCSSRLVQCRAELRLLEGLQETVRSAAAQGTNDA